MRSDKLGYPGMGPEELSTSLNKQAFCGVCGVKARRWQSRSASETNGQHMMQSWQFKRGFQGAQNDDQKQRDVEDAKNFKGGEGGREREKQDEPEISKICEHSLAQTRDFLAKIKRDDGKIRRA